MNWVLKFLRKLLCVPQGSFGYKVGLPTQKGKK